MNKYKNNKKIIFNKKIFIEKEIILSNCLFVNCEFIQKIDKTKISLHEAEWINCKFGNISILGDIEKCVFQKCVFNKIFCDNIKFKNNSFRNNKVMSFIKMFDVDISCNYINNLKIYGMVVLGFGIDKESVLFKNKLFNIRTINCLLSKVKTTSNEKQNIFINGKMLKNDLITI